jgi:hypothetical protein
VCSSDLSPPPYPGAPRDRTIATGGRTPISGGRESSIGPPWLRQEQRQRRYSAPSLSPSMSHHACNYSVYNYIIILITELLRREVTQINTFTNVYIWVTNSLLWCICVNPYSVCFCCAGTQMTIKNYLCLLKVTIKKSIHIVVVLKRNCKFCSIYIVFCLHFGNHSSPFMLSYELNMLSYT